MKKLIIILLMLPLMATAQFKVPAHTPNSYVSDFDHILSTEQTATINQRLAAINKASSVEIAVVVLSDLQGYEIEDVATSIFRTWGIGKKGLDNGLLYIVSPANRKGRIEVGNGLEGDLSDAVTKDLQIPARAYFKQGQYYEGILQVIDGIEAKVKPITQEQQTNFQNKVAKDKQAGGVNWWLIIITLGLIGGLIGVVVYVRNKTAKKVIEERERLRKEQEERLNSYNRSYTPPSTRSTNIIAPIIVNNDPPYTPPSHSTSSDYGSSSSSDYGSSSSSYDSGSSSSSFDFGGGSSSGGGSSDSW